MARPDLCTKCASGIYSPRCLKWGGISCRDRREIYNAGAREALEREAKRVDAAIQRYCGKSRDEVLYQLNDADEDLRTDGLTQAERVLREILDPETKP